MDEPAPQGFADLLTFIRQQRGVDLSGYKPASVERRIRKRLVATSCADFDAYRDHLEVHPDEFVAMFASVFINVTAFARDPEAWDALREVVVPAIIESVEDGEGIRVWSAACSTGQEAYTLAMVFADAIGIDGVQARVKIYGTDVDDGALEIARRGVYAARDLAELPENWRERYFTPQEGDTHRFTQELRRSVIFGRHDLVQDAPISRLHLLVCRNALMYFNTDIQREVLDRFHFALNDNGFLFLGKAETLLTRSALYEPVAMRHRIFQRSMSRGDDPNWTGSRRERSAVTEESGTPEVSADLVNRAFDSGAVAQILIDREGTVVAANGAGRRLFNLTPEDLGRPVQDLELSYRPLELRSMIDSSRDGGDTQRQRKVPWARSDDLPTRHYDVDVAPLTLGAREEIGFSISFADVSDHKRLENDLRTANDRLRTAYEELESTNEELETTNEELQSTIEELETTNEELHSSNEELETMNEELQSTNEVVEIAHGRLAEHATEVDELSTYLNVILSALPDAVVVLDRHQTVRIWSPQAADLWGVRADEAIANPLSSLDIGLPVDTLDNVVRDVLANGGEVVEHTLDARDRRGREGRCRVRFRPLRGEGADGNEGVILTMTMQINENGEQDDGRS